VEKIMPLSPVNPLELATPHPVGNLKKSKRLVFREIIAGISSITRHP